MRAFCKQYLAVKSRGSHEPVFLGRVLSREDERWEAEYGDVLHDVGIGKTL